jgi:hypothetical protein
MKKRLFLSSAIMTGVLAVALSTGTYAWYQSSTTGGLSSTATETVETANKGAIGAVEVAATISEIKDLDLTDDNGVTKVWNGTSVVVATNQDQCTKYVKASLKFNPTEAQLAAYAGNTYTVKIAATDQVRIGTTLNTPDVTNGVYAAVGSYTAATDVTIGTITVAASGSEVTYSSIVDSAEDALYFYVSVSPKKTTESEDYNASTSYGKISITSIA